MLTLYCLKCASGCLLDSTWYMWYTSEPNNIQLVLPTYPIHKGQYTTYPMTYIEYLMESFEQIA